ncbi:g2279 [Coccomyxa elongata]
MKHEVDEFGTQVQLLINLPDGTETEVAARMGYTVQHLKVLLHKEQGLPLSMGLESTDGRPLLDPLSLSDCMNIRPGATNVLIVKVV